MKYRFGMPWYGWLLLFLFVIFVPTMKQYVLSTMYPAPAKKDIVQRKE